MDRIKYKVLRTIRESNIANPVRLSDIYARKKRIMRYKRAVSELTEAKAIILCDKKLTITAIGIKMIEDEQDKRELRTRYWITTVISVIALALSIISIAAQLGIISLPGMT